MRAPARGVIQTRILEPGGPRRAQGAPLRACSFVRHRPEETVLYQVIEQHADAFFAHLRERDTVLPDFVREEFEAYLRCGRLEDGFVRIKCEGCRYEHLVAFSCERRGFCPSCASRPMIETAARLVGGVLPRAPIRQWVMSFPWPMRLVFATHPEVLTRVLAVVTRALSGAVDTRTGCIGRGGAETGVVTFVQRFGSALNADVHRHMLIPDRAWTFTGGRARFHHAPAPGEAAASGCSTRSCSASPAPWCAPACWSKTRVGPFLDVEPDGAFTELAASAIR